MPEYFLKRVGQQLAGDFTLPVTLNTDFFILLEIVPPFLNSFVSVSSMLSI